MVLHFSILRQRKVIRGKVGIKSWFKSQRWFYKSIDTSIISSAEIPRIPRISNEIQKTQKVKINHSVCFDQKSTYNYLHFGGHISYSYILSWDSSQLSKEILLLASEHTFFATPEPMYVKEGLKANFMNSHEG